MQEQRLKYLLSAYENDEKDAFTIYALGIEYLNLDADKAYKFLKECNSAFPDYLPSYYHLGLILGDKERYEEAETVFLRGIDLAKKTNQIKTLDELQRALRNLQDEAEL